MSYNRDEASFHAASSPPLNASQEYYGFSTHKQWCDYAYPEGPLDVINVRLAAVDLELGPARINVPHSSHSLCPCQANLPQSAPSYLYPRAPSRPQTPLDQADYDDKNDSDESDDSDDSIDLGSPSPVLAQSQVPVPAPSRSRFFTVANRPAEDAALVGTDFEERPDPIRAATMARLTREARTGPLPPGVSHRNQLDILRDMPLRRQLSLQKPHRDFIRTRPDCWDATAG